MTTTSNLGLPIYGASDVPKWDDTNTPFQNLDSKAVLNDISNTLTERLILENGENLYCGNFDIANPPSSNTWGDSSIRITDKNTNRLWFISPYYKTDGSVDLYISHDQTNNASGKIIINNVDVVNKLNNTVPDVSLTSDGVKTVSQFFDTLHSMINFTKFNPICSKIECINHVSNYHERFYVDRIIGANNELRAHSNSADIGSAVMYAINCKTSSSTLTRFAVSANGTHSYADESATTWASGLLTINVYY